MTSFILKAKLHQPALPKRRIHLYDRGDYKLLKQELAKMEKFIDEYVKPKQLQTVKYSELSILTKNV